MLLLPTRRHNRLGRSLLVACSALVLLLAVVVAIASRDDEAAAVEAGASPRLSVSAAGNVRSDFRRTVTTNRRQWVRPRRTTTTAAPGTVTSATVPTTAQGGGTTTAVPPTTDEGGSSSSGGGASSTVAPPPSGTGGSTTTTSRTTTTASAQSTTTTARASTTTARPTTTASTTVTTQAPTTVAPSAGCANPRNPWASLEGCGWPGAGNTGARTANCPNGLTANTGASTREIAITADNTVISCQRITGGLSIQAKNVTVRDSVISYDGGGAGGSGVIKVENGASATIDHVELNGLNHTHSCVFHQGTSVSVTAMDCYGVNDGMFSWADTGYSSTTGDNFTLRDSWFHDLTTNAANGHIDGYQTEGAANGTISHNTFDLDANANSAIAIWNGLKSAANIAVTGNLITGGGFSVYAEDYHPSESSPSGGFTVTNITFTNNVFSTKAGGCVGAYGAWFFRSGWTYQGGPTDGWHRSGNTVLETGENIDGGNPHSGGRLCS